MRKKYTIILSIVGVIQIAFSLTIPILSKFLIEYANYPNKLIIGIKALYFIIIVMSVCLLLMIAAKIIYNLLYASFVVKLERYMKQSLYDSLIKKDYSILNKYHAGEIEQLFHSDIINVIKKYLNVIPSIIIQLARLIISVGLMLYIDWKFLLFIIGCGILGFGLAKLYSHVIKPKHKKVLELDGKANSFLVESVNQFKLIQAYSANEYASEYYNSLNDKSMDEKRSRNKIIYGASSGVYAFTNIIYVIALFYGAISISKGLFTYGSLLAIIQLLSNIQNPIISMSPLLNHLSLGKTSEERIEELKVFEEIKPLLEIDDFDYIEFKDVSFSFDNERYILKNFNQKINKNDVVLLSGPSGVGKTTLFMLLLGFIKPTSGSIIVKYKENEYPISSATRKLFSYVPQENIIFSGSIKDNLYILTGKNDETVIDALKKANIYDEIMEMPDKLDTKLNERGVGLSIGQIQRILIAASILEDNPILLLDEFSSALDSKNEDSIIDNIKSLNKTIIYITHRNKEIEGQKVISFRNE